MCCWWNPYARGVPCLWVKCLDRPSVPILGCSIELLGILFSLQMIQLKCHAATMLQMHDNATILPLLFPMLPCVWVCPPHVCLQRRNRTAWLLSTRCGPRMHIVRTFMKVISAGHLLYQVKELLLFVCTSDLYRSLNGDPCQGLLWVSKYYEWQALYKTVSQGLGHNSKAASPQSDWKQKRKPPCAKCTFSSSKHYFWRNPLAPTHFQILVWQRKVREEECFMAVTPRTQ